MKRLIIASGLCVMFTLLGVFSAKADGWRGDRREWRERRCERREWRHERYERVRPCERYYPRGHYYR